MRTRRLPIHLVGLLLMGAFLASCGSGTKRAATSAADGAADAQVPAGMTKEQLIEESFHVAVELFTAGHYPDAKDAFVKVLALDKKHVKAIYYMGEIAIRDGALDDAAVYANEALALDPKLLDAMRLKVRVLKKQDRHEDALVALKEAADKLDAKKDDEKALKKSLLTDRLSILVAKRDYMAVIKEGKELLFLDPKNAEAMREIGRGYLGLHKPGLARYVFKNSLELKPDAIIEFYLGNIAYSEENFPLALHHYQKAVDIDGTLKVAYNNMAFLNQKAGNHPAAIENLKRALSIDPTLNEARINLGNSYRHTQNFKEAEATYMDVKQRDPDVPELYYNLGVLYLENPVPGYEDEDRYAMAAKNFSTYRELMGGRLQADDPSAQYIKEAQILQQQTLEMKEQMRQMEEMMKQQAEEGGDDGGGEMPMDGEEAPMEDFGDGGDAPVEDYGDGGDAPVEDYGDGGDAPVEDYGDGGDAPVEDYGDGGDDAGAADDGTGDTPDSIDLLD
jgi:tetratricopeptide (TPR) repeat protein